MSSGKFSSYMLAGLLAPLLSVCSCAMIPIFGGLLISGAGMGPALTFLLIAPAANVLALIFTGTIISIKIMLYRFLFSFMGAMIIAYLISFSERYLPAELVINYLSGTKGVVLGAVIGVPTYTPTLVEVFLIKSLLVKGMSPAAALAFLIGAPMASIPSMMGVSRIIGWKVVLSYALLAVVIAIGAGLVYQSLEV